MMKKLVIIIGIILLAGVISYPVFARGPGWGRGYHMRGYGGSGSGQCWEYDKGYGRGPGMMGPGSGYGSQFQGPQRPLEEKEVRDMVENYIQSTQNPNLKLGRIEQKESTFVADILTKDDSLVDKIAVDRNTGWMRSVY